MLRRALCYAPLRLLERGLPMRLILCLLFVFACVSAWSKDQFDRPSLDVPKSAGKLSIAFADETLWDGRRIPKSMQCSRLGGENPSSPALVVTNTPDGAKSLVVFFANPRMNHNHGLVQVADDRTQLAWMVPSIRGGIKVADAPSKLPKGVAVFDGGDSFGRAYSSPCPSSGSWLYTVTVYALDEADKVLATGEKELGYAP